MGTPGASVRVLPPLVYLVPLGAGLLLDRLARLALPGALPWRVAGAVLLLAGLALMAWAAATMLRAGTTVIPWEAVTHLLDTGPFRHSRNPIYLGDALVYVGACLLFATWWPLLFLPVVLLVIHQRVIGREEAYLRAAFPDAYAAYSSRVRRWL